jgi:O-antigen/teichoic acid export membrane protein
MHLGLGQIATTLLTIGLNAAIARTLGPAEFGDFYLVMAIAGFTFVVVDWGHPSYVVREAARDPARTGELTGSTLAVRAIVALAGACVAGGTTKLLGYAPPIPLLAAVLIVAWLPMYQAMAFGWTFRAHQRMDLDASIGVCLKSATLVAALACFAAGGRTWGLVIAYAVAGLLALALATAFYRRLGLPRLSASVGTGRELITGGFAMFTMTLAIAVEPLLAANILHANATPEGVGWYGAAMTIAGTLLAPAIVVGSAVFPNLSVAADDPDAFRAIVNRMFKPIILIAVLGGVGTYLFANVPIDLIYGKGGYGPAAEALRAFAPVLVLMYVDTYLGTAIVAGGGAGRISKVKIAVVALTTLLFLLLVPLEQARSGNGGIGVMHAMLIGEVVMFGATVVILRDRIDGSAVSYGARCALAGVLTAVLLSALPAMPFAIGIPLCVAAYAGFGFVLRVVTREHVMLLRSMLQRR